VLDRPTSFSRRDFQSLLMQWTEVLASVRAPFENGADWYRGSPNARKRVSKSALPVRKISSAPEAKGSPAKASSSAADLHSIWESASDVDIDTTLAVLPLGSGATKAVYWVHPDNIVQIHVLLLQYTRLQRLKGSEGLPEPPQSSISSPWSSVSANGSKPYPRTDEEIGVIICDDLQNFAERRNSETISDSEDRPGTLAEKAVASIRYSYNGEAVIVVGTTAENRLSPTEPSTRQIAIKAKLECKEIHKLFNTSKVDQRAATNYSEDAKRACQWLAQHQEVQPLVQLQARRARFVGLKNITSGGIWATLDKDILMRCTSRASLNNGKVLNTIGEDGKAGWNSFRHAVLEIRAEGDAGRDLVIELDNSHLVSN